MKATQNSHTMEHTENYVHVQFSSPHLVLSSGVLSGGLVRAKHIVNLKVEENFDGKSIITEYLDIQ